MNMKFISLFAITVSMSLLIVSFRPENSTSSTNNPNGWWLNTASNSKASEYVLIENGELRRFNTSVSQANVWVSLSVQNMERVKWNLLDEGVLMIIKQPLNNKDMLTRSTKTAYLSTKGDTLFYKRTGDSIPFDTEISHYVMEYSRKSDGTDIFRERVFFLNGNKTPEIADGWYASDDANLSSGWYLSVEGSKIKRYLYVNAPGSDSLFIVCQMIPQSNSTYTYHNEKDGHLVERYETENHTFYKYFLPAPAFPYDTTLANYKLKRLEKDDSFSLFYSVLKK